MLTLFRMLKIFVRKTFHLLDQSCNKDFYLSGVIFTCPGQSSRRYVPPLVYDKIIPTYYFCLYNKMFRFLLYCMCELTFLTGSDF